MKLFILCVVITLTSCVKSNYQIPDSLIYPPSTQDAKRPSYSSVGKYGMVSSAHPLASEAGLKVLQAGGNAVDAAIATSIAISVLRPQSTGIGGGGFLLFYDKKNNKVLSFDFRETAPKLATRDMYLDKNSSPKDFFYKGQKIPNASINGHLSVGVPGLVRGLWDVHSKHGKLPWRKLFLDGIALAKDGFPAYPSLISAIKRRSSVLSAFPDTKRIFFRNDSPIEIGSLVIQSDLAKTLTAISMEGDKVFYEGWIAQAIADEMKDGNGILSLYDLKSYKSKQRSPILSSFRGYQVASMPPPSSGGVHIAQMLNILEKSQFGTIPYMSAQYVNLLTETMRQAYADRSVHLGDPDFYKVPIKGLTSKEYGKLILEQLPKGVAGDSQKIKPGNPMPYESPSTTHFSIVDQWGNAVSSTQTINYTFGSGVVAKGTGIILNDEMDDFSKKPGVPNVFGLVGSKANEIQAHKRMLSSMSPTMVFKQGELVGVIGSPGGSRIINATLQTITNRFVYQMSPEDSVHASRIHHQWLPDILFVDRAIDEQLTESLVEMGYKIKVSPFAIGDIQAIFKTDDGWVGVSDTRSDGRPLGY